MNRVEFDVVLLFGLEVVAEQLDRPLGVAHPGAVQGQSAEQFGQGHSGSCMRQVSAMTWAS
jgi:hypothetical protein